MPLEYILRCFRNYNYEISESGFMFIQMALFYDRATVSSGVFSNLFSCKLHQGTIEEPSLER